MTNFAIRAFHLDLRIQVMTPGALRALADELVGFGFTTLVIEWEAAFPFRSHPVLANRYVYSRREIADFLKYCRSIGLKTLPIQQCFGHVEYILRHDRYAHLREDERDICQICPQKADQALPLFKELFSELMEAHDSEHFYVGCDETYVLGKCPACAARAAQHGKSRLYVDYLKQILELVNAMGKRPVCPADMLLKHPEAAGLLPKNTLLVDWNYGWAADRFGDPQPLRDAGFEFWGAMSLRCGPDNYYLTSWERHLGNFRDFVPYCRQNAYQGIVLTSWSTSGIYGFEWDTFYEPVAMHPIRRVYPLKGFRLLQAAFAKAVSANEPLEPAEFVKAYAKERFGLSAQHAASFHAALMADASPVYKPKKELARPVGEVLKSAVSAKRKLQALRPVRNASEFEHFKLMAAIRENYLHFKLIEEITESAGFDQKRRLSAIRELKLHLAKERGLARDFSRLTKGYLHPAEIASENGWRSRKWTLLLQTLQQNRTAI